MFNVIYIDVHQNQLAIQQRELVLNVVCNLKIITYLSTFCTRRTILRVGHLENIHVDCDAIGYYIIPVRHAFTLRKFKKQKGVAQLHDCLLLLTDQTAREGWLIRHV